MAKRLLEIDERSVEGSTACNRLRREGLVPGNVYGLGRPSFKVQLHPRRIDEVLRLKTGQNTILTLQMANRDVKRDVMIRELQRDPITDNVIHVDFVRIDPTKPVQVPVPIHFEGVPVGVRLEGGVLDLIAREVDVECLPDAIPAQLDVDVSELHLNQHVSVSDLDPGEGVTILEDEQAVIAVVAAPKVEEEPVDEEADEAAEGAEAAEPAAEGDEDSKKDES